MQQNLHSSLPSCHCNSDNEWRIQRCQRANIPIYCVPVQKFANIIPPCIFFVMFRGLSSRIHDLQHRHESQKSSGLIDGETLVLVVHVSDFRTSNIIYDSTLKMMVKTGLSRPTKHKEIIDLQDLQLINAYLNKNAKNPVLLRLRLINIFKDARGQTFRSTAFPYQNLPTLFHLVFLLLCFVAYRRVFIISRPGVS
jgi:hypothetical protein